FARRRKIESAILYGNSRAVITHSRRLVSNAWLIETVSYRIDDPLAILVRAEGVAADRRLGSDRTIPILDEQVQIKLSVSHGIERYNRRRPNDRSVGHGAFGEFVSPIDGWLRNLLPADDRLVAKALEVHLAGEALGLGCGVFDELAD